MYHRIALRIGISDSTLIVLCALAEAGNGCRQKDISHYFCLSKQTINSCVKNLSHKGLITLHPEKGRDLKILLTPTGNQFVQENVAPLIQKEVTAFNDLGSHDLDELLRITEKYLNLFKEKSKDLI